MFLVFGRGIYIYIYIFIEDAGKTVLKYWFI